MGLPPATVKLLLAWNAVSPFKGPNDYVFCSELADALDGKAIWRYVKVGRRADWDAQGGLALLPQILGDARRP